MNIKNKIPQPDKTPNPDRFKTCDTSLAAFLVCRDIRLVENQVESGRMFFLFKDAAIDSLVLAYQQGAAVSALRFVQAQRSLRELAIQRTRSKP